MENDLLFDTVSIYLQVPKSRRYQSISSLQAHDDLNNNKIKIILYFDINDHPNYSTATERTKGNYVLH